MSQFKLEDNFDLPDAWKKPALFICVGSVCLLVSWLISFSNQPQLFFHSYLTNLMFVMSFSIGGLFFVLIQFLCRAGWSATVRRVAELTASLMPWLAVLFIPIIVLLFFGRSDLYEWNVENPSGVMKEKSVYLNKEFFTVRAAVYLGLFSLMATWLFRLSRSQDEDGNVEATLRMQKYSGLMVMAFALILSGAAFDWVMSIDFDWYSTIFGVYWFAGCMLSIFSLMVIAFYLLQKQGRLVKSVNQEHYHDMAKFLFGFTMFWAYIAFSQFMLYWYGNIPEETAWYDVRQKDGWIVVAYALIVLHFAVPFLGTMSRTLTRRHPGRIAFWAVWIIFVHWLDMTFLIMPNVPNGAALGMTGILMHALGGIGMTSIFVGLLVVKAADVPLVAVRDPRLQEALSYSNPLY